MSRHRFFERKRFSVLAAMLWLLFAFPLPARAALAADRDDRPALTLERTPFWDNLVAFTSPADLAKNLSDKDCLRTPSDTAFQSGSFRLTGSHMPIKFTGTELLSRTLLFNGSDPHGTRREDSEVAIDLYDLTMAWNAGTSKRGAFHFEWGPEISLKVIDSEVSDRGGTLYVRENDSVTVPFATAGAWARMSPATGIDLTGRFGYMEYNRCSLFNGDIQVEVTPVTNIGFFLGYRHIDFDMDEAGNFLDDTMSGFYGGALIRY